MTICSKSIKRQRILAKFIYIQRLNLKTRVYDIGILDDKYNYYEECIDIRSDAITPYCYKTLNRLFGKYLITKETEIDFLDTIQRTEVIYMYLSIRNQAVFANMRFLNIDMIPRRIVAYHVTYLGKEKKPAEITKFYIERLWRKLVELEKCSWITKEVDAQLNNVSNAMRKRMLLVRMALYYMIVKRFLVLKSMKSTNKAKEQDLKSMIS